MKLIVGLGNPGNKYIYTRHNIGFLAINKLINKLNLTKIKNNFNSLIWEKKINNEKIIFCKPQTFINLSCDIIYKIKKFYNLSLENIIIIYDDKDINFNVIKLKKSGSSAGHNGIKNLIQKLGNENFLRIRLGIGENFKISTKKWVLENFSSIQLEIINNDLLERLYIIITKYLIKKYSFDKLMSIYNTKKNNLIIKNKF